MPTGGGGSESQGSKQQRYVVHDSKTGAKHHVQAGSVEGALREASRITGRPVGVGRTRDFTVISSHGIH